MLKLRVKAWNGRPIKVTERFKEAFFVGAVILLISGVIWWMIQSVLSAADKIWTPVFQFLGLNDHYALTGAIGTAVLTIMLTVAVGWLLTAKFFENKMLGKIPLFGFFWTWAKKISHQIDREKLRGFTPVYIEFLVPGFQWIGFMSGVQKVKITRQSGTIIRKKMVKIFSPNPPVPFTGQGFFTDHVRVIGKITNDFDELMNIILSATFISPDELNVVEMPELNEENFEIEVEFV